MSHVTLLNEGKADTLLLGQGDEGLFAVTDHENVSETGGERVTLGVLDVSDLVRTGVVFNVLEHADTTDIVTTGNEDGGTVIELDNTVNFTVLEVELDGVVLLDVGVGETDGSTVVGDNVWDLVLTNALTLDLAKLEASFLGLNSVGLETSLDVVEHTEVLTGLVDGNNILETNGVLGVTSDLVVDSDVVGTLVTDDLDDLLAGKSVLQSVSEED